MISTKRIGSTANASNSNNMHSADVSLEHKPRTHALGHTKKMAAQSSGQKLLNSTKSQKSIKIAKSPSITKMKPKLVKQGSECVYDSSEGYIVGHSFVSFEKSLKGLLIKKKDLYTGEESPNEDEGNRTPVHRGRGDSSQEMEDEDIDIYSNHRNKLSTYAQNCSLLITKHTYLLKSPRQMANLFAL